MEEFSPRAELEHPRYSLVWYCMVWHGIVELVPPRASSASDITKSCHRQHRTVPKASTGPLLPQEEENFLRENVNGTIPWTNRDQ